VWRWEGNHELDWNRRKELFHGRRNVDGHRHVIRVDNDRDGRVDDDGVV
jgi:hypothetical protein